MMAYPGGTPNGPTTSPMRRGGSRRRTYGRAIRSMRNRTRSASRF